MQAYQQRVVDEKASLDDKLAKLIVFIDGDVFAGLDAEDRNLLLEQRDAMDDYSGILGRRITRFAD